MCFKMEGMHPSMSYMFDGCGILAQAKRGGVYAGWRDRKITRRNVERVVAYLPLSKPERVYLRTRPKCLAIFFELPFIVMGKSKEAEGTRVIA